MKLDIIIELNDVCGIFGQGNEPEHVADALRKLADEISGWDYFTLGELPFEGGVLKVV